MDLVYLYTKTNCEACEKAEQLLLSRGFKVSKHELKDPLEEVIARNLFKDNIIRVPLVLIPNKGVYMLNKDADDLLKLKSL